MPRWKRVFRRGRDNDRHIVKLIRSYSCHKIFDDDIAENKTHKHGQPHENAPFSRFFIENEQQTYYYPNKSAVSESGDKSHYAVSKRGGKMLADEHQNIIFPRQNITFLCLNITNYIIKKGKSIAYFALGCIKP